MNFHKLSSVYPVWSNLDFLEFFRYSKAFFKYLDNYHVQSKSQNHRELPLKTVYPLRCLSNYEQQHSLNC